MREIDPTTDRPDDATGMDAEGTSTPSGADAGTANADHEWRPADQPTLRASFSGNGDAAWSSPEAAPAADVVPSPGRPAADPRSFVGPEDTPSRGLRKPPIPSIAAIAGHPIHPMIVPLPIGALSLALASDVAFAATGDRFWARASRMLIGAGIATGALAGAIGSIDFTGREQIRSHGEAWLHVGGNAAALAISAVNLAIRQPDETKRLVPTGLALSALTGALLLGTGWLGGELSYRHRVGVMAE